MTNAIYQATVEALEAYLPPRVVSRSLQEGMKLAGKTPATIGYSDIEKILKAQVYMQLQVTMPVTQAKATVQQMLERLKQFKGDTPLPEASAPPQADQGAQLAQLRELLRPFNLYFEWPEVQKLRALIQLIEAEHAAERDASKLIADAKAQLEMVEQKLEDQLVQQAKALGDLEASLEVVRVLGGPKVRRLESLIGQVAQAQASRQLAAAEVERARKLVTELRKLMESSVIAEADAGIVIDPERDEALLSIDSAALDPEVSERLLEIDLDSERQDLAQLEANYRELLEHRADLRELFESLRAKLAAQTSVAAELAVLPEQLAEAQRAQREALQGELAAMAQALAALEGAPEELPQLLQLTQGVLETTLPPLRDLQHLRSLYQLAQSRSAELARQRQAEAEAQAARLAQQAARLARFEAAEVRFARQPELASAPFSARLAALRQAHAEGRWQPELLNELEALEAELEAALARQAAALSERQQAQLRGLQNELARLPELPQTAALRAALTQKLQAASAALAQAPVTAATLEELRQQLARLRSQTVLEHARALEQLVSQAEALGASALKGHLEAAKERLAEGVFPDLAEYERSLAQAIEVRRGEQLSDLRLLEEELSKFAGASHTALRDIEAAVAEMREALAKGELVSGLDELWELLDAAQRELARRSADFVPRLDAALALFDEVAKLNTDEVAALRRTLRHLDAQRYVFNRVSAGMRSELEAALLEAEQQLAALKAQYDATREVAHQLAASNALDGLLGLFDEPPKPPVAAPAEPSRTAIEVAGKHPALDALIARYRQQGVGDMAVVHASGELLSGYVKAEAAPLAAALAELQQRLALLGEELGYGAQQLAVYELPNAVLICAWPDRSHAVVALLERPAMLSLVLHNLRQELTDFAALSA